MASLPARSVSFLVTQKYPSRCIARATGSQSGEVPTREMLRHGA